MFPLQRSALTFRRKAIIILGLVGSVGLIACDQTRAPAQPATDGSRLYGAHCLSCHQARGNGVPGVQPPLAGTPVPIGDPNSLLAWVMFGVRPADLPRGHYAGVMPQFNYLSDAQLASLLTYVRSSFGNQASAITVEQVAAVRQQYAGR
jgi:mono/diheme cytochrome c family protein